jgi:hypothetical protein
MLILEYNTQINNGKFFTWSDASYGSEDGKTIYTPPTKTVNVIWANGHGEETKDTAVVLGSKTNETYSNIQFDLDI